MNVWSSLEKKVVSGSTLAFGILIFISVVSLASISQLVFKSKEVKDIRRSIAQLDHVLSHVKDVETGSRGYVITGKPAYLEPYQTALREVQQTLRNLNQQFAHRPLQRANLQKLTAFIENKVSVSKKTIDIRKNQGLAAAISYCNTDVGKQSMDQIRLQIARMTRLENEWLAQLEKQQKQTIIFTVLIILLGSVLALIINFVAILFIRKDVRIRQATEDKIRTSEQLLKNAQQLAKLGSWEYQVATQQITLSEALCDIFKVNTSHRVIKLEQFYQLLSPEKAAKMFRQMLSAIQSGEPYQTEYQVQLPNGEQKWLLSIVQPQREPDGSVLTLVGTSQDITEQKEIEEALRKSESRFSTAFQLNPFPTAITRFADGKILAANEQATQIFGYTYQELIGSTTFQLQIWEDIRQRDEIIAYLEDKHTIQQIETSFRKKTGQIWPAMVSLEVIELDGEKCILWIMQDITERKREKEAIQNYSKELERANAQKDRFFSIIAHDLRSPLNGVIGSADVLAHYIHRLNTEEISKFAENIQISSLHLNRLLNNLFEWASMQTGEIQFNPSQVPLCQVVMDVIELLRANAQKKNLEITCTISEDCLVHADRNMLHTILRNLVSNAIKFTAQDGFIKLTTEESPEAIIINVIDSGVGITAEAIEKIFRIDTKHSTQGTAGEKGTGLGLIICKEFVEKHGGRIDVVSQPGEGTRFHFSLPQTFPSVYA